MTAVVIANDEETLPRVSQTLEKAGFLVVNAANGAAAIDRFRKYHEPVDLAVIDTAAAGKNVEQLQRQLHEISPTMKMLFLSDEDEANTLRGAGSLGHVQGFLRKPFRRVQLLGRVLEIMEKELVLSA